MFLKKQKSLEENNKSKSILYVRFLLIYFIGKYFYKLSEEYNQNKWLYAILGIVVYYAAGICLGFVLALADLVFELNSGLR